MNNTTTATTTYLGTKPSDYTRGHERIIDTNLQAGRESVVFVDGDVVWVFDFATSATDGSWAMSFRAEVCDVCGGHGCFDDERDVYGEAVECADCSGTGVSNTEESYDSLRDVSEFAAIVAEFFRLTKGQASIPAVCVHAALSSGVVAVKEAA